MATQSYIQFLQLDSIGFITLNRPHALNALNHAMVIALYNQLERWANDTDIKAVIIQGAGDKAFCAGGDIRAIYEARDNPTLSDRYFYDEYRLNHQIYHYPKPYIALLNGITMGGGVGVSLHGSHRIATEHFVFAMPEAGIGFHPDVGGSYLLTRCLGQTGTYLALTGARIKAADALYLGLIDYYILNDKRPELLDTLACTKFPNKTADALDTIIKKYTITAEPPPLIHHRELIDECFQFDTVEAILAALQEHNEEWCHNTAKTLLAKSPLSLKVILQQLRNAVTLNIDECLEMEYRLTTRFLRDPNFYEGIRAAIIDKDQRPHWHPTELNNVKQNRVNTYFQPLPASNKLNFVAYKKGANKGPF